MLLVLDYDETYTEAPVFWDNFIANAKAAGHTVVCCTMRVKYTEGYDYYNEDVVGDMGKNGVDIVFAAEYKDKWDAMEQHGYEPQNAIWIDDRPMYICINREVD